MLLACHYYSFSQVDTYIGEIRMFAGNFAPAGWAFCNGQILPISQNSALFSIIGTTYGGDGKTNFALPNLQGRAPLQPGQGEGLSLYQLGEQGGSETVTLLQSELPSHTHIVTVTQPEIKTAGTSDDPTGKYPAVSIVTPYGTTSDTTMAAPDVSVSPSGGGNQPMNNMQPYLTVNYIIALQGIYPPRQ
ncbi:phage tail protein [Dysgonomonas sp. 520]|nr:phage tail protein [Dysgonomonas sp. 520]